MDYDSRCRACMRRFSKKSLRMDLLNDRSQLRMQFTECCGRLKGDKPRYLCSDCGDKTTAFYQFKQMCLESERKFQEWTSLRIPDETDTRKVQITPTEKNLYKRFLAQDGSRVYKTQKNSRPKAITEPNESSSADCSRLVKIKTLAPRSQSTTNVKSEPANNDKKTEKSEKYQCNICAKVFLLEHTYVGHMREHQGLAPFPCDRKGCNKSFKGVTYLKRHLDQHDGIITSYPCTEPGCNRKYSRTSELLRHVRNVHWDDAPPAGHVCEVCGKVVRTITSLKFHRLMHKDRSEWPEVCDFENCGRRFILKSNLEDHRMRHFGIKNFTCPYCNLQKTTRGELKAHINLHTKERQYPCKICAKCFYSGSQLRMHVRKVHEKAQLFNCRHCHYRFRTDEKRKDHEKCHDGKQRHQCSVCERAFTQARHLTLHMRKIHTQSAAAKAKQSDQAADSPPEKAESELDGEDDASVYEEEFLLSMDEAEDDDDC